LNYELDTYLDALKVFPENADSIETAKGLATLQKRDIFKNLMWYSYSDSNKLYPLTIVRVKEILEQNKIGIKPEELQPVELESMQSNKAALKIDMGFVNDVGQITLKALEKGNKKKKSGNNKNKPQQGGNRQAAQAQGSGAASNTPNANRAQGAQQNRPQQNRPAQGAQPQRPQQNRPQGDGQGNPNRPQQNRPQGDGQGNPNRPQQNRPQGDGQGNPNRPQQNRPQGPRPQQGPRPPRPQGPRNNAAGKPDENLEKPKPE
jgi:hypothetical protein